MVYLKDILYYPLVGNPLLKWLPILSPAPLSWKPLRPSRCPSSDSGLRTSDSSNNPPGKGQKLKQGQYVGCVLFAGPLSGFLDSRLPEDLSSIKCRAYQGILGVISDKYSASTPHAVWGKVLGLGFSRLKAQWIVQREHSKCNPVTSPDTLWNTHEERLLRPFRALALNELSWTAW